MFKESTTKTENFRKNYPKKLIYGPVNSRRLGWDLGVNPLHPNHKWCTFDCPYCQDGVSRYMDFQVPPGYPLASVSEIASALAARLRTLRSERAELQHISLCGNGEPTLHPQFPRLVDSVLRVRSELMPEAKVNIFSNGTTLDQPAVFEALLRLDLRMVKLDAGSEAVFRQINRPNPAVRLATIVEKLAQLAQQVEVVVQAMFVHGVVDNTAAAEIDLWIQHLQRIRPSAIHIYSLDRRPVDSRLQKVSRDELEHIAARVREETALRIAVF